MAKTALIQRELKRDKLVAQYAKKYEELKSISNDAKKSDSDARKQTANARKQTANARKQTANARRQTANARWPWPWRLLRGHKQFPTISRPAINSAWQLT